MRRSYLNFVAALSLLAGCASQTTCSHAPQGAWHAPSTGIVNNTPYEVCVHVDGLHVAYLYPGQQCQLARSFFRQYTSVAVFAYDSTGHYVGADSYIFSSAAVEVWQLNSVIKVKE